uniref:Uncharacterized protein n=1 Tax=Eutreptiella gymnastica TaxID=73025 RepID=A0A7S4FT27_9EUGL
MCLGSAYQITSLVSRFTLLRLTSQVANFSSGQNPNRESYSANCRSRVFWQHQGFGVFSPTRTPQVEGGWCTEWAGDRSKEGYSALLSISWGAEYAEVLIGDLGPFSFSRHHVSPAAW